MPQADFAYAPANDVAGLPLAASIFADHAHVRDDLRHDVEAAGLAVHDCAALGVLFAGERYQFGGIGLRAVEQHDLAERARARSWS